MTDIICGEPSSRHERAMLREDLAEWKELVAERDALAARLNRTEAERDSERLMRKGITVLCDDFEKRLARATGHLRDVLKGDDGQAWKEAQRFLDGEAEENV